MDDDVWNNISDTNSEIDSTFNDTFTSFNRASSTAPSTVPSTSTVSLDEDQSHATKKTKLYKSKRKYSKTSWVWQYMIQENEYDICQVPVMNMQNEEICCGQRFLHDGSTGNMANHLRGKHDINGRMDKVIILLKTIATYLS